MFRIGDFSRLARVTIKTLHHYDEAGLLQPAHVDPQTGYRYYAAAQLQTLQRILLLKDLGFSLDQIRDLLATPLEAGEFLASLEERRSELLVDIARDQSRVRKLDALRESLKEAWVAPAVIVRDVPAISVHSIRARVPHFGEPVQQLFESAETAVARLRARADASPFMIFHDQDYREEAVDIEVCIPVKPNAANTLLTRTIEAASSVGCLTYQGPYDQTAALYGSMLIWMERSGLRIAGSLREVYHRFGADQTGYRLPAHMIAASSKDYVTELQVPVAPIF